MWYSLPRETIQQGKNPFKIDDKLIEGARRLGRHETREEAIKAALEEYVRWRDHLAILSDFGTVDFDPEYDYRAERRRKRC